MPRNNRSVVQIGDTNTPLFTGRALVPIVAASVCFATILSYFLDTIICLKLLTTAAPCVSDKPGHFSWPMAWGIRVTRQNFWLCVRQRCCHTIHATECHRGFFPGNFFVDFYWTEYPHSVVLHILWHCIIWMPYEGILKMLEKNIITYVSCANIY